MKIKIEDATQVPDWIKVALSGDELDLTKIPQGEDVQGLKDSLQKERGFVAEWKSFKEEFGIPSDARAAIAKLKDDIKTAGGKSDDATWQAKLDALEEKHKIEIGDRDKKIGKIQASNAAASLKAELAKVGFIPEAIEDIAGSASSRLQYNEDGSVRVLTAEGKPMIGSGADHGATLSDLAKELAEAKPYAVADAGKGGGGKPSDTPGGKPTKKFSEMTSGELVALMRANPQEYDRLKAAG